jgi:hypothetical protein
MRTLALILCTGLVCAACTTQNHDDPVPLARPRLVVRDSIVLERANDCKEMADECDRVEIHFPVFDSGAAHVAEVLNRKIREFYVDQIGPGEKPLTQSASGGPMPSIIDAARVWLGDMAEDKALFPVAEQAYYLTGQATVLANDSIACVRLDVQSYSGGAHPNAWTSFLLVDTRTGRELTLKDVVADTTVFANAVERAFRAYLHMDSAAVYADSGYFMESNQFSLPSSIGVTPDSVIICYNPYEIAAYALGYTEFTMPRSTVRYRAAR